jgi:sugar phosphate isomerase/epimerase
VRDLPPIGLCWGTIHQASLEQAIELAARHGFPTLQIPPDILLEHGDAAAIRRQLRDAGVEVRLIDAITAGIPGMRSEPVVFRGRKMPRHDAATCLEVANAIEAPLVNISHYLGSPVPLEQMAEGVARVCRMAAAQGATIVLEFVPDSGIRTIGEAAEIALASGEANCKVHLDTWHLARSGGSAEAIRQLSSGLIGAFQLSDRKEPAPGTAYVPMTGRLLPGEGELPLGAIVAAALANSPELTIEVEVFSEELGAMTADQAAQRVASAVAHWRAGVMPG